MFATRETTDGPRPVAVLALPATGRTTAAGERLRAAGWRVLRVATAWDARRLACARHVDAVVLPAHGPEESGFLTCAKLRLARPRLRVLLVGERTPAALKCARFVGAAALVPEEARATQLAAAVLRTAGAVAV